MWWWEAGEERALAAMITDDCSQDLPAVGGGCTGVVRACGDLDQPGGNLTVADAEYGRELPAADANGGLSRTAPRSFLSELDPLQQEHESL